MALWLGEQSISGLPLAQRRKLSTCTVGGQGSVVDACGRRSTATATWSADCAASRCHGRARKHAESSWQMRAWKRGQVTAKVCCNVGPDVTESGKCRRHILGIKAEGLRRGSYPAFNVKTRRTGHEQPSHCNPKLFDRPFCCYWPHHTPPAADQPPHLRHTTAPPASPAVPR